MVSVHQNGVLLLLPNCRRAVSKQQQEQQQEQQQQQQQQQQKGMLGFVPTLHLADEVSVAAALQKSLKVVCCCSSCCWCRGS